MKDEYDNHVKWTQFCYPAPGVVVRELTDHDPGDEDDFRTRSPMSFRCEQCGFAIPNSQPQAEVVVRTRNKYSGHSGGDYGTEIVQAKKVCQKCQIPSQ